MKSHESAGGRLDLRRRVLLGAWVLAFAALLGRSVQLQVLEHEAWTVAAGAQHRSTSMLPAARGEILDRSGNALAVSRERWEIGIAPNEIQDVDAAAKALGIALGAPEREMRAYVASEAAWRVVPGRYSPTVREDLGGVRGIHLTQELARAYPRGDLAMGLLGSVVDGVASGGVEEAFDEVLRGTPGQAVSRRDSHGRDIPGQTFVVEPPQSGGSVELTLDMDLQEIAQDALERAIERTGARGGDLLVSDPKTGDILSMVSIRDGLNAGLSGLNAPYEPGSTLKPFTVAALLENDAAALDDSLHIGPGVWRVAGRTLRDVSPKDSILSLASALRVSSNVGIAKAAQALDPAQQYRALRDFGFGAPTALGIPGESPGILRRPKDWSRQSPASLAIGYEIGVTPLQLVSAYGALANGGLLMAPRLVQRVRDADGNVVEETQPRVVRRVVSEETAEQVTRVLEAVVEDGSGTAVRMQTFAVAGKTGTSQISSRTGSYETGEYYSSFAGFFPADNPQFVVLVKLEGAQGEYYGGRVAAPVTRETLEAILAARRSPLDIRAVARSARSGPAAASEGLSVRFASLSSAGALAGASPTGHAPVPPPVDPLIEGATDAVVPVPDVGGLPVRVAVRRLHALGLRVDLVGAGDVTRTIPAAGTRLAAGDTVVVRMEPSDRDGRRE